MNRKAFTPHNGVYIQYLKNSEKHNMPVLHYHDGYEIFFLVDGMRYVFFDNVCYMLKRGGMAIIKPFELHYAESRESDYYERYVLNFNIDMLSPILRRDEIFLLSEKLNSVVFELDENQIQTMLRLFKSVDYYSKRKGAFSDKLLMSAIFQLLVYITECFDDSGDEIGGYVSQCVSDAIKYINGNYTDIFGLDEIADYSGVSKSHLCHKFKECTGATVKEYLDNVRLAKAHNMLVNSTSGIDEIAEKAGFISTVNLTRAFKRVYGVSPSAFRRGLKKS